MTVIQWDHLKLNHKYKSPKRSPTMKQSLILMTITPTTRKTTRHPRTKKNQSKKATTSQELQNNSEIEKDNTKEK